MPILALQAAGQKGHENTFFKGFFGEKLVVLAMLEKLHFGNLISPAYFAIRRPGTHLRLFPGRPATHATGLSGVPWEELPVRYAQLRVQSSGLGNNWYGRAPARPSAGLVGSKYLGGHPLRVPGSPQHAQLRVTEGS